MTATATVKHTPGPRKRIVRVTQLIEVATDDAAFDADFFAEFNGSIFQTDTVDDHAEHLAQLFARGIIDGTADEFIEGYGPAKDMGIEFRRVDLDMEVVEFIASKAEGRAS